MPENLNITFIDAETPPAPAGIYTVTVEHVLTKDGSPVDATAPLPETSDAYEVRAARFMLDPSSIHSVFPPEGASGLYANVLPHITLTRAVLPWERQLQAVRAVSRPPWLAVLVLASANRGEGGGEPATVRPAKDLINPGQNGVLGPAIADYDPEELCSTIDLDAKVFSALVPREDELPYLTHVRDVVSAPQRRESGEVFTEGEYAVVTANRFPRTDGDYTAHLVSLEGWINGLGSDQLPANTTTVRLASLWSWSFSTAADGAVNPEQLLRDLTEASQRDQEALALRLTPQADAGTGTIDTYVRRQLQCGFVPVASHTLSGEQTFAWYRGPFTPLTAPPLPPQAQRGPHTSADHAMIYDKDHGLFEYGYAAAWTLGRVIGLADPDYSAEAVGMRREMTGRAAALSMQLPDVAHGLRDPDVPPVTAALDALAAPSFRTALLTLAAPLAAPPPPSRPTQRVRASTADLLAEPRTSQLLAKTVDARTPTMPTWLEQLSLLYGVSFAYLVPHPSMLPAESLRLFRIDQAWINALVDGAADIGASTSADRDLEAVLRARLARDVTAPPQAGMLVNSLIVTAWPEMDILATTGSTQAPVSELRRSHLAPTTLLILWDRLPDEITFREPGQGIHFGLNSKGRINLRHLVGDAAQLGFPTGQEYPDSSQPNASVFDHLRPPADSGSLPDVLDLTGAKALIPKLASALSQTTLSPSQFALELINAPVEHRLLSTSTTAE